MIYLEPSEWKMAPLSSNIWPSCSASSSLFTPSIFSNNHCMIAAPENTEPIPIAKKKKIE